MVWIIGHVHLLCPLQYCGIGPDHLVSVNYYCAVLWALAVLSMQETMMAASLTDHSSQLSM